MKTDTPVQVASAGINERVPVLDVLRGSAISLVVIYHFVQNTMPNVVLIRSWTLNQLLESTWAGVDLFFVLSGFLIGGILLDNAQASNLYRVFFIRRSLRIWPVYLLSLLCFVVLERSVAWRDNPGLTLLFRPDISIWSYFAMLQNFPMAVHGAAGQNWLGVTWSLAIEEQFYVLLPLIIRCSRRTSIPYICVTCIVTAPIVRSILLYYAAPPLAAYVLLPCRMDSLFFGVLTAWAIREPLAQAWLERHAAHLRLVFGASFLAMIAMLLDDWQVLDVRMAVIGYTVNAIFCTGVLYFALRNGRAITAIPGTSIVRRLGLWCFSLYLFHQPIIGLVHGVARGQVPRSADPYGVFLTLCAAVLTILVAAILWKFVEWPLISVGHRFRYARLVNVTNAGAGAANHRLEGGADGKSDALLVSNNPV